MTRLILSWPLAAIPLILSAQTPGAVCDSPSVRVATPALIYVHCDQRITQFSGSGVLVSGLAARKTDPTAPVQEDNVTVTGSGTNDWLQVRLATPLIADQQYALVVRVVNSVSAILLLRHLTKASL